MRCIYIQSGNILAACESAVSSNYAAENDKKDKSDKMSANYVINVSLFIKIVISNLNKLCQLVVAF